MSRSNRSAASLKAWKTMRTQYKKRGMRTWTRKSVVKLVYQTVGHGAARLIGQELELRDTTLSTWFSTWGRA